MTDRTLKWPAYLDLFALEARARGFAGRVLTECESGPLVAWERAACGPRIYISAGIHGDEPAGPLAMLDLMQSDFFTSGVNWLLCPVLNPDGVASATRHDATGRDLNRDYWNRHTPEVRAHAAWLESLPAPDMFISLHEDWETHGFYLYEINLGEDDPQRAPAIIKATHPWFPAEPGPEIDGHQARADGWIYHRAEADLPQSWPEAIFLAKHGCPLSFTFETPSQLPLAVRAAAHVAAVREAVQHFHTTFVHSDT